MVIVVFWFCEVDSDIECDDFVFGLDFDEQKS